jgi:hypothetical protein
VICCLVSTVTVDQVGHLAVRSLRDLTTSMCDTIRPHSKGGDRERMLLCYVALMVLIVLLVRNLSDLTSSL